jgi:Flp pilus assembly protein TadD
MPTIEQGKALHRMGRIAEAEAAYHSVLAREPRHFEALHLLGLIRYQQGRAGEAHQLLSRADQVTAPVSTGVGRFGGCASRTRSS